MMTKDEDITSYMLWVDEFVIGIKGVDGEVKEDEIVKKVMIYLPKSYRHKVFYIEESKDLD